MSLVGESASLKTLTGREFASFAAPFCRPENTVLFTEEQHPRALLFLCDGKVKLSMNSIAGRRISLKDFRTLVASAAVLETLAATEPAASERARRSQLRSAVSAVAEDLANTPTVCRKSYVHEAVVNAFEQGALARLRKHARSPIKKAEVLARIVARHSS